MHISYIYIHTGLSFAAVCRLVVRSVAILIMVIRRSVVYVHIFLAFFWDLGSLSAFKRHVFDLYIGRRSGKKLGGRAPPLFFFV